MLNELKIKNAKPAAKDYKLSDSNGLYLLVKPTGSMLWRTKYRYGGKEKLLSLGQYPVVTLKEARDKLYSSRMMLDAGIDPSEAKKNAKAARYDALSNSFESVARDWAQNQLSELSKSHVDRTLRRAELYLFPYIGKKAISDITAIQVLDCLMKIKNANKLETARRVQQLCGQIFRYAVQRGKCARNPTVDLLGALPPATVKNMAAFIEPAEVSTFLRSIDGFKGSLTVACALKLAPLLFVRPGELRQAKWKDIDLESKEWRYVVSKTKTPHIVPLSMQALKILEEIKRHTNNREHVFPGGRDPKKAMSAAAINAALQRMGYNTQTEITGHGFRAMARTLLAERLNFDPAIIEHQLAHAVKDANGEAYNRTKFLAQRVKMMQIWADYLDELKAGAKVVQFNKSA